MEHVCSVAAVTQLIAYHMNVQAHLIKLLFVILPGFRGIVGNEDYLLP